ERRYVGERQHHTVWRRRKSGPTAAGVCGSSTVRKDAKEQAALTFVPYLVLDADAVGDDLFDILHQGRMREVVRKRANRTPDVLRNHAKRLRHTRRELADAQLSIEEHRRDFGSVEQVLGIGVEFLELEVFLLVLGIDRVHLLVDRVQFFVRALKFLFRSDQFLVRG